MILHSPVLVFSKQRCDQSEGAQQVSVLGVKSQLQRVAAHAAILVLLENLDSTKCGIARGWVSGLTRNLEHGLPQVCFHRSRCSGGQTTEAAHISNTVSLSLARARARVCVIERERETDVECKVKCCFVGFSDAATCECRFYHL